MFSLQKSFGISLIFLVLIASLFAVGACTSVFNTGNTDTARYITWESREMDTWASVWLISHYIDPQAEVIIRPTGSPTHDGTPFAVADTRYRKVNGQSTFEHLVEDFKIDAPEVKKIAQLIQAIEVAPWSHTGDSLSRQVEQVYRHLDNQFRPEQVPVSCYNAFFESLAQDRLALVPSELDTTLLADCAGNKQATVKDTSAFRDQTRYVRLLPINNILQTIGKGKRVLFVDARESSEYDETHIPGAINIKLRDINDSIKPLLADADLVVAYCIKDFRGYEVANALKKIGVNNVATMAPYGLAGWRSFNLPTAGKKSLTEPVALKTLTDFIHGKALAAPAKPGNG